MVTPPLYPTLYAFLVGLERCSQNLPKGIPFEDRVVFGFLLKLPKKAGSFSRPEVSEPKKQAGVFS